MHLIPSNGQETLHLKTMRTRDLPGGPVVKNGPRNPEATGSIPSWELGFHVIWSNQSSMLKLPSPPPQLESLCTPGKDPVPHNTLKIPCVATKTQHSQINQ